MPLRLIAKATRAPRSFSRSFSRRKFSRPPKFSGQGAAAEAKSEQKLSYSLCVIERVASIHGSIGVRERERLPASPGLGVFARVSSGGGASGTTLPRSEWGVIASEIPSISSKG